MKTYPKLVLPLVLVALLAGACASIYTGVVTVTTVVDTAMKSWAELSVNGYTTAAVDARVIQAHNEYRAACGVAQTALQAYKISGDPLQYNVAQAMALAKAKEAANALVDLIVPLLPVKKGTEIKTQLVNAKTL